MNNMKKVPFSLELAKQGVSFRLYDGDNDNTYIADYEGKEVFFWYIDEGKKYSTSLKVDGDWHHLIPEEPVKERWAVVQIKRIYNSKLIADLDCEEYNDRQSRYDLDARDIDKFTVVKLAE